MKVLITLFMLLATPFLFSQGLVVVDDFNVTMEDSESLEMNSLDLDYTHVIKARGAVRNGSWTIYVTLLHNDSGWGHYADRWQIIDPATGEILAERILGHPHENEQPFTRSLSRISLPASITVILIRGACQVHGFGGSEITIDLITGEMIPDGS